MSKTFDKSKKIPSVFCFELKEDVILLVSRVHAWLVECDFLKPNWQFERILFCCNRNINASEQFFLRFLKIQEVCLLDDNFQVVWDFLF